MSAADSSLPWMGPGGMDAFAVALSGNYDFPIALRIAEVHVGFTGDVARQLAGLLSALADVVEVDWPWAPVSVHNGASGRPGLVDGEADAGTEREAETAAASLAQQEGHLAPLEHGGESALDRVAVRVGATVKALREAYGWRVGKFAVAIGVTHSYLCNIEAGRKRLTPELARKVAVALNVPLAAIVTEVDARDVA